MLGRSWRGIGSGILAGVLLGAAFPYSTYAETSLVDFDNGVVRGTEVCGISVRGLAYEDAVELENGGFKYGKDYVYDEKRKMYVPTRQEVRDGLGNMLMMLQMNGVDVNQIVDDRLKYSIVRADMKDILGHAFVWQDNPEIYLYGKYTDFWEGAETEATIVHEFGHYVEAKYMSDLDRRIAYAKLRGLPKEMVYMTQDGADWGDLFEEIFAEDYKTLFVDGSLYKANQRPLSVAKREKLRDLIVGWMVEDMEPSRSVSRDLDTLRRSGVVSDGDVLFCDDQAKVYLGEGVSGSDLVNWLVEMYYGKSERVGNLLTKRDIDQEIHKRFGFYPSDVDTLSSVRYMQIVGYFTGEVDRYVRSQADRKLSIATKNTSRVMSKRYGSYTKNVIGTSVYLKWMDVKGAKGYSDGKVTRGELAHWIVKSKGVKPLNYADSRKVLKSYTDVDVTNRYGRDVATVIKNKWMYGVKTGSFGYKNVVTKEQAAYLLGSVFKDDYLGKKKSGSFTDMKKVSGRYKKDVDRLRKTGVLLSDTNGRFNPKKSLTRTQWLGMLTRVAKMRRDSNIRVIYGDENLLSMYGIQSKLKRGSVGTVKLTKRDVIKWMK